MYEIIVKDQKITQKIDLGDFVSIDGVNQILEITSVRQDDSQPYEKYGARPVEFERLGDDFEVKVLGSPEKYGFTCIPLPTRKKPLTKNSS